jgi:hypothetical protein
MNVIFDPNQQSILADVELSGVTVLSPSKNIAIELLWQRNGFSPVMLMSDIHD